MFKRGERVVLKKCDIEGYRFNFEYNLSNDPNTIIDESDDIYNSQYGEIAKDWIKDNSTIGVNWYNSKEEIINTKDPLNMYVIESNGNLVEIEHIQLYSIDKIISDLDTLENGLKD